MERSEAKLNKKSCILHEINKFCDSVQKILRYFYVSRKLTRDLIIICNDWIA